MSVMYNEREPTIVVVEDEEGHAFLIEKNLKRSGIPNPIIHLTNGQEAVDFFEGNEVRGHRPNSLNTTIVFLDLNLPLIDGFGVLEKIRHADETRYMPVLIFSSTTREHEIKRCYELGCSMFLNKPVDYASFSEAILQLGKLLKIIKVQT